VYADPNLPCEFCQSRKKKALCIKTLGPKAVAYSTPLRQIPTAMDDVVDSEDAMVLQYAYSLSGTYIAAVVKLLAVVYGTALPNSTLRQAVLAYAASKSSNPSFQTRALRYKAQATAILSTRLGPVPTIDETDFFAVYFLAYWGQNSPSETRAHRNGGSAIYEYLSSNESFRSSDLVIMVGTDFYPSGCMGDAGSFYPRVAPHPTFGQRVQNLQQLRRAGTPPEAWQEQTVEALFHISAEAFCITFGCIVDSLRHEYETSLGDYIEDFEAGLRDLDCRKAIEQARLQVETPLSPRSTVEQRIRAYALLQLQTVRLVVSIWKSSDIGQGFISPETSEIAKELIQSWRSEGHSAVKYYDQWYWEQLAIVGIALPTELEDMWDGNTTSLLSTHRSGLVDFSSAQAGGLPSNGNKTGGVVERAKSGISVLRGT